MRVTLHLTEEKNKAPKMLSITHANAAWESFSVV